MTLRDSRPARQGGTRVRPPASSYRSRGMRQERMLVTVVVNRFRVPSQGGSS